MRGLSAISTDNHGGNVEFRVIAHDLVARDRRAAEFHRQTTLLWCERSFEQRTFTVMGDIAEAQVKQQDVDISYMHWIRGAFLGLVVSALPCTLAVYSVATNTSLEEHPHFLGFEVVGPAVVQAAIELGLASKMAPAIAFELVEERSANISMKQTIQSTLIIQLVVSAVLLLATFMLMSGDAPTDDPMSRLSQWYNCQILLSLMCHVTGLLAPFLFLVFVQPLSDSMALVFISANMMYFGESMAFSLVGVCNLLCAAVLWILGQHGPTAAIVGCCAIFYPCTRMIVIYSYFTLWQNPDLSAEMRRERLNWGMQHATTGKNHLGQGSRETRVRDARRYVNEALDGSGIAISNN